MAKRKLSRKRKAAVAAAALATLTAVLAKVTRRQMRPGGQLGGK